MAEVLAFDMPGTSIPGYLRKATQLARAGIFDLRIFHDEVLMPILRHWRVFELEGLSPEAELRAPATRGLPAGPRCQREALRGATRRSQVPGSGAGPRRVGAGLELRQSAHGATGRAATCTLRVPGRGCTQEDGSWPETSRSRTRWRGSRCSPTWTARPWNASSTPRRRPWFPAGDRIIREGLRGSGLHLILEGEAVVIVDGTERARFGPGDFFGEISVLLGVLPVADIVAVRDTRALVLSAPETESFLVGNPRIMYRMLQAMARRLRASNRWTG